MKIKGTLALCFVAFPCLIQAQYVYRNLDNITGGWTFGGVDWTPEFGDRLELAGTDRVLQSVTFRLGSYTDGNGTGSVDAVFRVYDVDPVTQFPGNLLSQATVLDLEFFGTPFLNAHFLISATMPSAVLPDEIFATIEVTRAPRDRGTGFSTHPTPEIGSSDPNTWYELGSTGWLALPAGAGGGNVNIGVTAVPEPASCAALVLGTLALALRRRRC